MQHESKFFVYLQRLITTHAGIVSAMHSVTGLFFARIVAHIPATHQPRERLVMGLSSACDGLDSGKWHVAFFVPQSLINHTIKHTNKMEGKTSQSITFKADWLDFTEQLERRAR